MNSSKSSSHSQKKSLQKINKLTELTQIVEHTSDLIWICDSKFKIIYANHALKVLTGFSNQKVMEKEIEEILFYDDQKKFKTVQKAVASAARKNEKRFTKKIYHRIKRKNRPGIEVETVISIISNGKNKNSGILGITRAITNDTPTEEELRKSNLSMMFAQQLAHLGTYQFDEDDKNNLWSDETFKIYERDKKSRVPSLEEFYSIIHPEDQSFVRNNFTNALRNNSGFNIEYRIITAKEKIKFLHSIGQAFHTTKKSAGRIFGIVKDITERKNSEENLGQYLFELKKSKNLLEDRAMELAILNEQLTAASNELSRTNEEKDKFFSILAHDLRSPFHGLLGFSNMLIAEYDSLSDEEKRNIAGRINHSAHYVFKLIENLLEWSRLQSGRMEIKQAKTDLNETVLYIFNLLNSSAVAKDIKLVSEIPEATFVFADANMLNSVIENLVSNAIKFSVRRSEVIIYCTLNEKYVEVFVKDKGVGIRKTDIDKLFKIDSHHSTSGTEEERGTGLGLILCREMIEKMDGHINVDSKENEGSTFSFTIPAST